MPPVSSEGPRIDFIKGQTLGNLVVAPPKGHLEFYRNGIRQDWVPRWDICGLFRRLYACFLSLRWVRLSVNVEGQSKAYWIDKKVQRLWSDKEELVQVLSALPVIVRIPPHKDLGRELFDLLRRSHDGNPERSWYGPAYPKDSDPEAMRFFTKIDNQLKSVPTCPSFYQPVSDLSLLTAALCRCGPQQKGIIERLLKDLPGDVHKKDTKGITPIMYVAALQADPTWKLELLHLLDAYHPQWDARNQNGWTVAHYLALSPFDEGLWQFVLEKVVPEKGCALNTRDEVGCTPLMRHLIGWRHTDGHDKVDTHFIDFVMKQSTLKDSLSPARVPFSSGYTHITPVAYYMRFYTPTLEGVKKLVSIVNIEGGESEPHRYLCTDALIHYLHYATPHDPDIIQLLCESALPCRGGQDGIGGDNIGGNNIEELIAENRHPQSSDPRDIIYDLPQLKDTFSYFQLYIKASAKRGQKPDPQIAAILCSRSNAMRKEYERLKEEEQLGLEQFFRAPSSELNERLRGGKPLEEVRECNKLFSRVEAAYLKLGILESEAMEAVQQKDKEQGSAT